MDDSKNLQLPVLTHPSCSWGFGRILTRVCSNLTAESGSSSASSVDTRLQWILPLPDAAESSASPEPPRPLYKVPWMIGGFNQFVGHLESTFHNLLIPSVISRLLFTALVSILTLVSISENASLFSGCSFFHNSFFFPALSRRCPLLSPKSTNYRPVLFLQLSAPLFSNFCARPKYLHSKTLFLFSFLLACGVMAMNGCHDWLSLKATSKIEAPAVGKVLL